MTETISYPFTSRTYVSLSIARGIAAGRGHIDITAAHIAVGILREGENPAVAALHRGGVSLRQLRRELEEELPPNDRPRFGELVFPETPVEKEIVNVAVSEVAALDDPYLGNEHLLLAILREPETSVARLFARHGITHDLALSLLRSVRSGE